jgi:hypothetical protein
MPLGLGFGELVFLFVPFLLVLVPAWRILRRAGFAGGWSLLILVPLVNLLALYAFAFVEWPVERRAPGTPTPG